MGKIPEFSRILCWDVRQSRCTNRLGTTLNVSRAVTFIEETLDRIDTRPAEDVNLPEDDARERVMREIVKRQGQQEFRQRLLEAYQGRCAITDSSTVEVLEAAHIRPFNGPETNKLPNGLLLRSDLHTLFDMGFITISPEMKVSVSDFSSSRIQKFRWQGLGAASSDTGSTKQITAR